LSPILPLFALIGAGLLFTEAKRQGGEWLFFLCLLGWLPLYLLVEVNVNRVHGFLALLIVLAAHGITRLRDEIKNSRLRTTLVAACAAVIGVFVITFDYYYFSVRNGYNDEAGMAAFFNNGLDEAYEAAMNGAKENEPIFLDRSELGPAIIQPYVYLLFFQPHRIDEFTKKHRYQISAMGDQLFYDVSNFGRFAFERDAPNLKHIENFLYISRATSRVCEAPLVLFQSPYWNVGRCYGSYTARSSD